MSSYNYTSETSSLLVNDLVTSNVVQSNITQTDVLQSFQSNTNTIVLNSNIIPSIAQSIDIGSQVIPLGALYSEYTESNISNVTSIIVDKMFPQNNSTGNITFFGNLLPSIDNEYYIGIPNQRWKYLNVVNLTATGNVDLSAIKLDLVDANTIIHDDIDPSKKFRFEASQISSNTLRTLIVPDFNTTLLGNDSVQVITNKTITSPTNTVRASQLGTTGSDVIVSSSYPPMAGQVLTAISATQAVWLPANVAMSTIILQNDQINVPNTPHTTLNFIINQGITISASNYGNGIANVQVSIPTTTKGDLLVHDGTNNVREAVGNNDYLLTANSLSSTGISWLPPVFKDNLFAIVNDMDTTRKVVFDIHGNSNTTTYLSYSSTSDNTLVFPETSTNIVGDDTLQTLTNKTIVDPSNIVRATQLATSNVNVDVSLTNTNPPVAGQVLVATSMTTAEWKYSNSIVGAINIQNDSIDLINNPHSTLNFVINDGIIIDATDYINGIANVQVTLPTNNKGDLLVHDGSINTNQPVGNNFYLLTANSLTSTGIEWAAPVFKDSLFSIIDDTDSSKVLKFNIQGNSNTTTNFIIQSSSDNNIYLPDASTTLVGNDTIQSLTNKTIIDPSNIVRATQLATNSNDIILTSSNPPVAGQVLVATSSTTAEWQYANTLPGSISLSNNGILTTGTPHDVLNFVTYQGVSIIAQNYISNVEANIFIQLPTTSKGDLLVHDGTINTKESVGFNDQLLTANSLTSTGIEWRSPIFKDSIFEIIDSVDNSVTLGFNLSGTPNSGIVIMTNQTSDRIISLPDATTTLVGNDTVQSLTNKTITDPSNLVRATQLATSNTNINIDLTTSNPPITGQVLVATSSTTAQWISSNNLPGSIVIQHNNIDLINTPNKKISFNDYKNVKLLAENYTIDTTTANVNVVLPITTKGDILVIDNTSNATRQAIGTDKYLLTANSLSSTGMSWNAPVFDDNLFAVVNNADTSKRFTIDTSNSNSNTITKLLTTTTNTTNNLFLPDVANDYIVSNTFVATLTNKTIVGSTNYVGADELKTTGAPVVVNSSLPPTIGQVLTSINATTAKWLTPSGNATNAIDNTFIIRDDADATKRFRFEANLISSNTLRILTVPNATTTLVGNDNIQTISNKSLIDTTTSIIDAIDNTKSIKFDAAGSTGTSTTLLSSQTNNRILTLPDVTDIIVSNTFTATLTNKTIVGATNYVGANELKTTGSPVVISAAQPPITGQVLTSINATSARWTTPSGNATNAIDNTFIIRDNIDPTKRFRFEANLISSNTLRILTVPNATTTLVGNNNVQTISNKSLIDTTTSIVDVTDNTKSIKFDAAGSTGTSTTLLSSQTVNRVLTLPNATDIIVSNAFAATLTNKTIVGATNYVGANELKTTGAAVVVSTAQPPIAGQVLTSLTSTSAIWKTISIPTGYADTQVVSVSTVTSTTSSTFVDLDTTTPFRLTTSNTIPMKYVIVFTTTFKTSSSNRIGNFILNIDGVDIASTLRAVDTRSSATNYTVAMNYEDTIANGKIIKVRYRITGGGGTLTVHERTLTIQGIYY